MPPNYKISSKKKPLPLTLKERRVLGFIEDFMHGQSVAPSYQEIKDHFGFASFNSVQRYLRQLQDKNYIYIPGGNLKRALQVLHSSHALAAHSLVKDLRSDRSPDSAALATTQNPFPTQPKKETSPKGESPLQVESLSLPLLGRVAAGAPIESFTHDEFVDVPSSLIRNPLKTFALVVQGQSMIEDGILDGDIIFVQKQTYANNGETIVAMVNNQATVKRFYLHNKRDQGRSNGTDGLSNRTDVHSNPQSHAHPLDSTQQVELRPANATMQSMWYAPYAVDIQGIVVGLIRRF